MKWTIWLMAGMLGTGLAAADVAATAEAMLVKSGETTIACPGADGWWYSRNELQHLAAGPMKDGRVVQVSKSARKDNADPIPAIVDFNDQLKQLGIQLIVLPVPPKAAVYPPSGLAVGEAAGYLQDFEKELTARGVEVLDLMPELVAARDQGVFCRQDSHWSPAGIELAARKLAQRIGLRGNAEMSATKQEVMIAGDLAKALDRDAKPSESVNLRVIDGPVFAESSPVLLLGDSHLLVFSTGADMLAEKAGLGEQLAYELRQPVDRMAIKGSASTPTRINLYRKAARDSAWLTNKKFVIWVFSCREFTESVNGWAKIPVLKK